MIVLSNPVYDEVDKALAEDEKKLSKVSNHVEKKLQEIANRATKAFTGFHNEIKMKESEFNKVKN